MSEAPEAKKPDAGGLLVILILAVLGIIVYIVNAFDTTSKPTTAPAISTPEIYQGMVFSPKPNFAACPTKNMLRELSNLAKHNDVLHFNEMMVTNGGTCMTLPPDSEWQVDEVDTWNGIVGFHLASVPNGGEYWAPIGIISSAPKP